MFTTRIGSLALILLVAELAIAQSSSPPIFLDRRLGEDVGTVDISEFAGNYPKKVIQEYEQAVADARRGDALAAVARLEEVIKAVPEFYAAHRGLGILYQRLERYSEAEREYGAARALNPRSAAPLVSLGGMYIEEAETNGILNPHAARGTLNKALESLQQALKLQPASPFAHYLIGVVYYKTTFYEEAEDHLKMALDTGSNMGFVHLALANVYARMQEWDSVVDNLDAYLKIYPWAVNREQVREVRAIAIQKLDTFSR